MQVVEGASATTIVIVEDEAAIADAPRTVQGIGDVVGTLEP
jgi:hypothetical protein